MILKQPRLFKKSKFYPEILNGDIDAIRTVYLTHGFLNPKIDPEFDIDSTGPVDIRIKIDEGVQTFVREVRFRGNKIFEDDQLESLIKTQQDRPFNPLALEDDYLRIIIQYDDLGYHDARVTSDVKITDSADLEYRIVEGERILISEIKMEVARPINKKRLKTVIGINEKTILTNRKVARARKRLYDLNIFSKVRVKEESLESVRGLKFRLAPKKPLHFGLRIGYSSLDGPKATVTCEHRNLFGSLRRVMVLGKLSYNELGSEINYRDPLTFGNRLEHGVGFRIKKRREIGYQISRLGGYATIIPRPFSIRYDIERITISDVEIDTLATEGTEWLRTLSIFFNADSRDDPIRPKQGRVFSNRIDLAGIIPEGKSNFIKEEFLSSIFIPWRGTVIGLRSDLGLARPFRPSAEIPIHSRFFLGGATTVRGYQENMIGPKDDQGNPLGGERYLLLSCEERVPIFWQFAGVFFVDLGFLDEVNPKASLGFGLRLHTPLGPLRLDYGRNLEGSGALHFAVGEAF